jgi:hypothetical protein
VINSNTKQAKKNIRTKEKKHSKYLEEEKKRILFKSKLEQMEIAYNNNEAKEFYQEVNTIRKGFKPRKFTDWR